MARAFGAIFATVILVLSVVAPVAAGPLENGATAYDRQQ